MFVSIIGILPKILPYVAQMFAGFARFVRFGALSQVRPCVGDWA
jgi:hypothetical protein